MSLKNLETKMKMNIFITASAIALGISSTATAQDSNLLIQQKLYESQSKVEQQKASQPVQKPNQFSNIKIKKKPSNNPYNNIKIKKKPNNNPYSNIKIKKKNEIKMHKPNKVTPE